MKITIESTSQVVQVESGSGGRVPARVWLGHTASGHEIHAFVTRIAVHEDAPPEVHAQFARELQEHAKPSMAFGAIPLRMIL